MFFYGPRHHFTLRDRFLNRVNLHAWFDVGGGATNDNDWMNFAQSLDDIAVPTLRTLHIMCNPIHLHSLKYHAPLI